jgi:hypothetical protein
MAFAEHTTIAIPGGSSQIESLREGDTILAAGVDLQWQARTLRFVAGSGSGINTVMFLEFGDRGGDIIVTVGQLFLMPDRSLKEARDLRLTDSLLGSDGQPVALKVISMGSYQGSIWDIATSMDKPHPDFAGHLLDANGVVAGDFDLQTRLPPPATTRG